MKNIRWKILIITCIVCLLPIFPGLFLWKELPADMAIHFNIAGQPDNFASKGVVVYGLPCLMMLLQIVCCVVNDINAYKYGSAPKLEMVTKWILPVIAVALQIVTLLFNLGWGVDIRKVVVMIIGCVFLAVGVCLPEVHYVKNFKVDVDKARKINRFFGIEMTVMGILSLITTFLPPITTFIWLFAMIPIIITGVVYSIKIKQEKDE